MPRLSETVSVLTWASSSMVNVVGTRLRSCEFPLFRCFSRASLHSSPSCSRCLEFPVQPKASLATLVRRFEILAKSVCRFLLCVFFDPWPGTLKYKHPKGRLFPSELVPPRDTVEVGRARPPGPTGVLAGGPSAALERRDADLDRPRARRLLRTFYDPRCSADISRRSSQRALEPKTPRPSRARRRRAPNGFIS